MKQTTSSNVKVCATCNNFAGERTPKLGGFVDLHSNEGKCFLLRGVGIPKTIYNSCGYWVRWELMT